MIRLPFECTYWLESNPCARCGGTGHPGGARDRSIGINTCWYCKGLGWKPTPAGRDLFYDVLALLGISVTRWPTRIDPFLVRGRPLTAVELEAIDKLMASHVGKGAVAAPA